MPTTQDSRTGEKVVSGCQSVGSDPFLDRLSGPFGDLKTHWPIRLLLRNYGSGKRLAVARDIRNSDLEQIGCAQLAVYSEIEQRQIAALPSVLKADSDRPDFLRCQRRFLAHELAFVPGQTGHLLLSSCVHNWTPLLSRGSQNIGRSMAGKH